MPKFLVISDVHRDIWGKNAPLITTPLGVSAVVLAGDIDRGDRAITWAQKNFSIPVYYLAGNHEHFGTTLDKNLEKMRAQSAGSNVVFMENDRVDFQGVRILGCTLWTDFQLFSPYFSAADAMEEAQRSMNDYARIRMRSRSYAKMRPIDTLKMHAESVRFLSEQLATPFEGATLVATHMAPSIRSVHTQYLHDLCTACYASNLDHLIDQVNGAWIHGHMHHQIRYTSASGRCTVYSNPMGYKSRTSSQPENEEFNVGFTIDL